MENNTNINNYSHPERDSTNSSPRSFDDHPPPLPTKLRFMCSYGGKIHPNTNPNSHTTHYLTYSGGDTKILSVDRSITFSHLISKLSSLSNYTYLYFKYQLPGEDLDSLISVTNDEDLQLMVLEYDRLFRTQAAKTPRFRLFVFPLNDAVRGRDWFVEGLGLGGGSNPDYLFGFDQGFPPESMAGGGCSKDVSDCGSEDRSLAGDFPPDFHQHNALLVNRKLENSSPNPNPNSSNRVYTGSYSGYGQKLPESVVAAASATVAVPVQVQVPVEIVQERHVASGTHAPSLVRGETPVQPVYYIPAQAGLRPATGQVGHTYYTLPNSAPGQVLFAASGMAAPPPVQVAQPKVVVAEPDGVAVGFDASGRRVYYTAAGGVAPVYKVMTVGGGASSAENKVAAASVNHQN